MKLQENNIMNASKEVALPNESIVKTNSPSLGSNNLQAGSKITQSEMQTSQIEEIINKARQLIVERHYEDGYDLLFNNLKSMQQKNKESKSDSQTLGKILKGYYLLGLCCIKLGKIKKAKDILISAYWKSLKMKEKSSESVSASDDLTIVRLKAFASLFESEGKYGKTLHEYSQCLYALASVFGPFHIKCLSLYFSIGMVFLRDRERDASQEAANFISKYVDAWFDIVLAGITQGTLQKVFAQINQHFPLDLRENALLFEDLLAILIPTEGAPRYSRLLHILSGQLFQMKVYLVRMVLVAWTQTSERLLLAKRQFLEARSEMAPSDLSVLLADLDLDVFVAEYPV